MPMSDSGCLLADNDDEWNVLQCLILLKDIYHWSAIHIIYLV